MTKKDLEILYQQALGENDFLAAEINLVLKAKNEIFQDFTKQVLERDNLINALRNTILELSGDHEQERGVFHTNQEQFIVHLKAKDDKIAELSEVIRGLESDLSALKSKKDPEELTKRIEQKDREIKELELEVESLEARVAEYTDIHKVNAYGLCALKEQQIKNDDWR